MLICVLVEIKNLKEKTFTYNVPNHLISKIKLGVRVVVPFGNRQINGLIIGYEDKCDYQTKDIIDVIDDEEILNNELIELGKTMSEMYLCSLMSAYQSMLPSALKFNKKNINIKYEKYIEKLKDLENPTKGESNILNLFKDCNILKASEIKNKVVLRRLIESEILKEVKKEKYRLESKCEKKELSNLTDLQKKALNQIINGKNNICLLRGVTGSGKTEIYMHLFKHVLKSNKTGIILVPEISLTTQLIERFRSVFQNNIAVLHSSLSDGEKYDEWRRIKNEEVSLVIGTRSAIFAPLKNIGMIIIDEEHEDTYKQENNPRYKAIDIAIKRSLYHNAKVVLGSATPSLESYAKASLNKYDLVELLERVNKQVLPEVYIIDMKEEIKKGNSILSKKANDLINDRLNKNEQIMILINRRGYSNYIMCNECGEVIKCPNCDISLTYHKTNSTLRCHYCGYATIKPNSCPKCNSKFLVLKGIGTEKIEELINEKYNARVIRMDKDSTSNKGSHEKIIKDFNEKKYDILLGTQMISKGLDFKDVTLVIVLNGDSSLNIPDYRSGERTFNLLTQVSGRAGRGDKKGIALIQTFNPNHYSILLSKNHDYKSFYNYELKIRKKLKYPPFCHLVAIRIISEDYNVGNVEIGKINTYLKKYLNNDYVVLGPTVSLRINNLYSFQLIIKYKEKKLLYEVLKNIEKNIKNNKIKFEIDFSPVKL